MTVAYDRFLIETEFPWCWYCGLGPNASPPWWHGPWVIERAHVVNKLRVEDRRAVILLCSLCHKASHGLVFPQNKYRPIDLAGMLWLKRHYDRAWYDPAWLQRHAIQLLPSPKNPFRKR